MSSLSPRISSRIWMPLPLGTGQPPPRGQEICERLLHGNDDTPPGHPSQPPAEKPSEPLRRHREPKRRLAVIRHPLELHQAAGVLIQCPLLVEVLEGGSVPELAPAPEKEGQV